MPRLYILKAVTAGIVLIIALFIVIQVYSGRWMAYSAAKVSVPAGLNPGSPDHNLVIFKNLSIVDSFKPSMQVKLIILTYMRSGSSFTGDLFNHHSKVFYVYEPLWAASWFFSHGSPVFFFNRSSVHHGCASTAALQHCEKRAKFAPDDKISSWKDARLKAFLDCDFYALDPATLSQDHLRRSLSTQSFHTCQKRKIGLLGTLKCMPMLFEACRQANVTAVKTIRYSMQPLAYLLKADPSIKVIHLVRDPRPTLLSQISVGNFKREDLNNTSRTFCQRVLADLQMAQTLKNWFPGRLLNVRYEDLAMEPLHFAKKLLAFAGLRMDEKLRNYVWNITSAGLPNDCAICTTRTDSRKTAMKWRTEASFDFMKAVDVNCAEVYQKMGYLSMPRESLVNLSVPSFLEPTRVQGLWV